MSAPDAAEHRGRNEVPAQRWEYWSVAVDREICRREGTTENIVTAPYSEMFLEGFSVNDAADCALIYAQDYRDKGRAA